MIRREETVKPLSRWIPPPRIDEPQHFHALSSVVTGAWGVILCFQDRRVGSIGGRLGGQEIDAHRNVAHAFVVAWNPPGSLDRDVPVHDRLRAEIPLCDIFGHRTPVEVQHRGIVDVAAITGPEKHSIAGVEDVETRRQAIPELLVAFVVDGRRPVQPVHLPERTPISGSRNVLGELVEHVVGVLGESECLSSGSLMGYVPHTKGLSAGKRRLVPGPHRVLIANIREGLRLGPFESTEQPRIGGEQLERRSGVLGHRNGGRTGGGANQTVDQGGSPSRYVSRDSMWLQRSAPPHSMVQFDPNYNYL